MEGNQKVEKMIHKRLNSREYNDFKHIVTDNIRHDENQRRTISISLEGLIHIHQIYKDSLGDNFNSHLLCEQLVLKKTHLSKEEDISKYVKDLCLEENKKLEFSAITYTWSTLFKSLIHYLQSNGVQNETQLWIDIVCIDQNSRYLKHELEKLPLVYSSAKQHFVMGMDTFTRGWCQFELAISSWYRWAKAIHDKGGQIEDESKQIAIHHGLLILLTPEERNKVKELISNYDKLQDIVSFENAKFTVEKDSEFVKESVLKIFPTMGALNQHLIANIYKTIQVV